MPSSSTSCSRCESLHQTLNEHTSRAGERVTAIPAPSFLCLSVSASLAMTCAVDSNAGRNLFETKKNLVSNPANINNGGVRERDEDFASSSRPAFPARDERQKEGEDVIRLSFRTNSQI